MPRIRQEARVDPIPPHTVPSRPKWAIEGLARALADELPRGLAAVPLNAGIINTDMLQS